MTQWHSKRHQGVSTQARSTITAFGVIWTHQQNSYDSVWNFTALRHWPYNVSTTCISERNSSSYFFEYWKCATASKWIYICVLLCYADIVVLYILMDAAWSLSGSDLVWQGFFFFKRNNQRFPSVVLFGKVYIFKADIDAWDKINKIFKFFNTWK